MDPTGPMPEIREPFSGGPRPAAAGGGDWRKPVVLGCGLVVLLLGVGLVLLVLQFDTLFRWGVEQLRAQVTTNLPADFTAADRQRLDRAFDTAIDAVHRRQVDPAAMEELQREILGLGRTPPAEVTRPDLLRLAAALEKVGGLTPAEETPAAAAPTGPPAEASPQSPEASPGGPPPGGSGTP